MECLKVMKDIFTTGFLLMLKQCYLVTYQLIENPIVQSSLTKTFRKQEKIDRQ